LRRGALDLGSAFSFPTVLHQFQSPTNIVEHKGSPYQHIVIPIPQDPITLSFQGTSPPFVLGSLIEMLTTIQFHDQLQLMTYEIGNVLCHRHLPSKLEPIQLLQPKMLPEAALGVRGGIAELTGSLAMGVHGVLPWLESFG
jgi:hypothetical protein